MEVFWHEDCLAHDAGVGLWEHGEVPDWLDEPEPHPETAARLTTMRAVLRRGPVAPSLRWRTGRPATARELASVHTPEYLRTLSTAEGRGRVVLEPNTSVAPGSWRAILAAAGTTAAATQHALTRGGFAYALVRPPGHHAQTDRADGYCLVNNPALAAASARADGRARVAVVDWDAHHGNGTQQIFYDDPDVLTVSIHMRHGSWGPSHPQLGVPEEIGTGEGTGRNVNVPLTLGSGDDAVLRALREVVGPVLAEFGPDFLVCASGFDASAFDPNARFNVTVDGFRRIGRWVRDTAVELTGGAAVFTQEGGYLRGYTALCLHALFEGLLDVPRLDDPLTYLPDDLADNPAVTDADLAVVRAVLRDHWRCLS
jgi:acetoin utilization deacetylase AcuC-like enzyme